MKDLYTYLKIKARCGNGKCYYTEINRIDG